MTNLTTHPSAKTQTHNNTPMDTCPISRDDTVLDRVTDNSLVESEPPVLRVAGIRLPHDQSPLDLNELHELLDIDVRGSSDTFLDGVPNLLSKGIFPDSKLPFIPSEILSKIPSFDTKSDIWKFPDISRSSKGQGIKQSEEKLADFLNSICKDIQVATGQAPIRLWNSNFCQSPLEGSPITRKPDIILVDVEKRTPITWSSVRAIAEVTTQGHETKTISNTVTDKSYIILTTQPNRVFVPILSFWGTSQVCLRLTVTDRQGQLRTRVMKLGEPYRLFDSINFLRALIGLCFTGKPMVGYDPTMETDEWDNLIFIACDDKKFKIISVIFESQSLVGRATRVWEVEFEGRRYILKDAWVEASRPFPEYHFLAELQGIKGVPEFYCGGDVCIEGVKLSTGTIRAEFCGDRNRVRFRRRTVTSSIGGHIASFASKRELISAIRDIAITLRELCDKDVIHRDVSYNNILLFDPEDRDPQEFRTGLLIDFEYATYRSRSRAMAPGSRTGTAPFMAIELLMKKSKIRHDLHHDLESLFFVLIYICTNLSGPGAIRTRDELKVFTSIPVSSWFKTTHSLREVGIAKAGALCDISANILNYFAPYFEDLKPCIVELFQALYSVPGTPRPIVHDQVIDIFTRALDILPHETTSIPKFSPLLVGSPTRVRKFSLGIHDKSLGAIAKKQRSSNSESDVNSGISVVASNEARGLRGTRSRKLVGRSGQSVSQPR